VPDSDITAYTLGPYQPRPRRRSDAILIIYSPQGEKVTPR